MTDMSVSMPATAEAPSPPTYRYFSGGAWREHERRFDDLEPYSGELFAEVAACGRPEAAAAVEAAAGAFEEWSRTTPAQRAELFLGAAEVIDRRRSEIASILARETGAGGRFADYMQTIVIKMLQKAAAWAYEPVGEILASDYPGTRSMAIRRPLGVVASFTPWNGASVLGWRGVILPLLWGNTVVSKPSELAPISAGLIMAEVCEEAGFPAGTVNVIPHAPGEAAPIADQFFEDDAVRLINFVGSVSTGRMLAERAGRALKRSVMELGGYNPVIVCEDVDLDYAAGVCAFSSFFHQGQICTSARRIYVERPIYEEFLDRFADRALKLPKGDPTDPATIVGPLITPAALEMVEGRVRDAEARGGRVLIGGRHEGQVYEPTILVDVPEDAGVSCEETFGPVVVVQPVESAEEAVADANRSLYGLVASILCRDLARAEDLGSRLTTGNVHINVPTVHEELHHPGGVVRDSGWGRLGPHSVDGFTDLIKVTIEPGRRELPIG